MSIISLSMIVKNEEKHLTECLESVKNVIDDIVIVDTGSTDKTTEIAEKYGASVFNYEWNNDFSAARNFALSKTKSQWVLYLDADERLDNKSKKLLKNLTCKNDKLGVRCKIYNIDEINGKPKLQSSTRLFKNSSGIEFRGKAHEQIDDSLIEKGYKIVNSELLINHFGYNIDKAGLREKAARNLNLLLEDYKTNPTGYCAFQIANSYSILNDQESTNQYYKAAIKDDSLPNEYKSFSLSSIAEYHLRLNDLSTSLNTIQQAVNYDSNNVIANLTASQIYFKAEKSDDAFIHCKRALEANSVDVQKSNRRLLEVFLDDGKIIYQGLYVTFGTNHKEGIDYFFEKLEQLKSKDPIKWRKELNLIQQVSMNSPLSSDEISDSIEIIDDNNLDFYLTLFKNYQHHEVKLTIDEKLISKFPQNVSIRNKFALNLSKAGKKENATSILEETLQTFPEDVTPIFYLISLYLEQQDLTKLENIISTSKKRYSSNKVFLKHLNDFENRINSYLLKTN